MPTRWTEVDLINAVKESTSMRSTLTKIGLKPTGGNYTAINAKIVKLQIDTSHFRGKAWNKGLVGTTNSNRIPTSELLKKNVRFQSYKLKKRLFAEQIKKPECELCGWKEKASDGRIPVELDHINGDNTDNRLVNLRILCPNCHSLQDTHRGMNINRVRASGGIGIRV